MTRRTFALPDLGEGLEDAEIARWLVAEGDRVALNQPLVEVETAKATVEIPSPHAGRIAELHVAEGDTVKVGEPLCTFEVDEERPEGPGPSDTLRGPVPATPAVRRLARDLGVDLRAVEGSGPGGRVTREDVERAAAARDADVERRPHSPLRRAAAERLTRAYAVPQVTTFRTVDCTALEARRAELRVSPLPVVVRALCEVIPAHPLLNASWSEEALLVHRRIAAGIATDTERGLVVPVLHDPERMGIREIGEAIAALAARAREGTLAPADLTGATVALTNTGSYGSEAGTPILVPGTAVTVGLGVVAPRPLVVGDRVVPRPACTLSVTFDHRVLDGADVGRALGDLVALLEDPDRLGALPA
ncbi:MAG TPA: dihydrolipoamide acetyltransferase family protein [Actinomycetota bacterium]|nr:dihydrolipoamide acetyltransferase family protein [Actinomycetota bacterium]